jgi:hypothetical protein
MRSGGTRRIKQTALNNNFRFIQPVALSWAETERNCSLTTTPTEDIMGFFGNMFGKKKDGEA